METVAWASGLEIGVKSIDEQHKHLVEMLNTLGRAIGEHRNKEFIMGIVEETRQYAVFHFKAEEAAMAAMEYPKRAQHKKEHDTFIEQVLGAAHVLVAGGAITPGEVWSFLHNWLFEHILDSDKAMGQHLSAKGMC